MLGGEASTTQPSPSDGEEELHSLAHNPYPPEGMLKCLQADLGDLADGDLHELMEDLHQEVALCELNAPCRNPPPVPWGNPVGNEDPNLDDQELTFLSRGG